MSTPPEMEVEVNAGRARTMRAATSLPHAITDEILRAVADIRYGSVEIVIHGGRVVQIEAREKRRFATADSET